MRLSTYAQQMDLSYKTALRHFHKGLIPGAYQLQTGTIIVPDPEKDRVPRILVGYARVSASDQADDLVRQADRLKAAGAVEVVSETGSGLNGNRPKLKKLLKRDVNILVEHRERLARFGFEYLEAAMAGQGRTITVLDDNELEDDLVRDMTEILTSMCARLYGRRGAKNRKARKEAKALCETMDSLEK